MDSDKNVICLPYVPPVPARRDGNLLLEVPRPQARSSNPATGTSQRRSKRRQSKSRLRSFFLHPLVISYAVVIIIGALLINPFNPERSTIWNLFFFLFTLIYWFVVGVLNLESSGNNTEEKGKDTDKSARIVSDHNFKTGLLVGKSPTKESLPPVLLRRPSFAPSDFERKLIIPGSAGSSARMLTKQ
jgi:hypothetical protein